MHYELMRPEEIRREIKKGTPLVWPIGVMEFHGGHRNVHAVVWCFAMSRGILV